MVGFPRSLRLLLAALLLVALAPLSGCSDDPVGPELSGDNLFELVTNAEDLSVLRELVGEVGLTATLRTGADLTFFAPSDEALLRLGSDMLGRLRTPNNLDVLDKIVRRHLVRGRFTTADLRDGMTLTPLAGPELTVSVDGEDVRVGGALVVEADFATSNGVLHVLGDVVRDHLSLAERLRVTPLISTFASTLQTADLDRLIQNDGPYTLLIPINSAFSDLGAPEFQSLLSNANRNVLTKVLRHHLLPGRIRTADLATGDALPALDGTDVEVVAEDGLLYLDGARVIVPEIETSDGLIYLLDTVVMNHLTLADRMQIAPQYFTAYSILRDSGLLSLLREDDDYTVFAPPEPTWATLGLAFLPELRDRPDLLLQTAQSFVVEGRVTPEDLLTGDDLTTLDGNPLPVTVRNDVTSTDVFVGQRGEVAFPPREARNGFVYDVAPFNVPVGIDLEERAVFAALYRFLNLAQRADLTSLLQAPGPYTVFAPTDNALEGVGIPDSRVVRVVRHHIVEGTYTAADLGEIASRADPTLETLHGETIEIVSIPGPNGGLFVNGIKVRNANNTAANGVIHTLEGVLMPSN